MKKSELRKYILEALTPDEASKVDAKYKEIYAGMMGDKPLKMKRYDNPDKVAYGRAIKLIQKESKMLNVFLYNRCSSMILVFLHLPPNWRNLIYVENHIHVF